MGQKRNLFPGVRVFRPNGSDTYSLVTGSERTIYYSTSNVSTDTGGYQYPLNPPIPVMSGDLLAVSQPELTNSCVKIYSIYCSVSVVRLLQVWSTCLIKDSYTETWLLGIY